MRDRAVWLEFQGAYRDAVVYVNDEFAGHRPYGYSIFHIPLHDHLRFGQDNTVRVEVRGHEDSRWYTGVGLLRDVLLHDTDPLHLVPYGVHVTHPDVDEERAVLEVAAAVVNERRHRGTVRVRTEVRDADGVVVTSQESPVTVPSGEEAVARQRLYLPAPRLWSVDDPYLYSVEVQLVDDGVALDSVTVPLGIRTIRLDPQHGLRINGHTVKLRGACVHHDNGALGGASVPEAEERRVRLLKDAGFNAIRAAHTPLSIAALDACDRLGMLVMDESFDVWTVGKSSFDYSLDFPEWWARDIESMVLKDRNHPSVIFYSIGNEIPETGNPGGAVWSRRLADEVRRHDSTRLVTNGVNGFVAALTDVMGMMSQATSAGESGGVNDAMGSAGDMMNQISASELVTAKTEELSPRWTSPGSTTARRDTPSTASSSRTGSWLAPRRSPVTSMCCGRWSRPTRTCSVTSRGRGGTTWERSASAARATSARRTSSSKRVSLDQRLGGRPGHDGVATRDLLLPRDGLRAPPRAVRRRPPSGDVRPHAQLQRLGLAGRDRELELGRERRNSYPRRRVQRRRGGRADPQRAQARPRTGRRQQGMHRGVRPGV